jgi:hypothetical protein
LKGTSHEEVVAVETDKVMVDFERMDCRDIQISRMAAKSLAEPLEACRPQEGLKTKGAQVGLAIEPGSAR